MKKVLIIIPNWNGLKVLKKCLASVNRTSYKNYEILVVDNGSEDGSVDFLKDKGVKTLFLDKNYGFDYAINRGIEYGLRNNFEFFLNLNNDAEIVQKDGIKRFISGFKDRKVGIVGAKIVGKDGRIQSTWYGERMINEFDNNQYNLVKEVQAVAGVALMYNKEVAKKIKFDERFFFGRDDLDFCFRTRKAGFKVIYNGNIKIVHHGSYSYFLGGGDKGGLIYKSIQKGLLIFTFRHLSAKDKIKALLRIFAEAFITKKEIWSPLSIKNMKFHWNFPERLYLSLEAVYEFIKDSK